MADAFTEALGPAVAETVNAMNELALALQASEATSERKDPPMGDDVKTGGQALTESHSAAGRKEQS